MRSPGTGFSSPELRSYRSRSRQTHSPARCAKYWTGKAPACLKPRCHPEPTALSDAGTASSGSEREARDLGMLVRRRIRAASSISGGQGDLNSDADLHPTAISSQRRSSPNADLNPTAISTQRRSSPNADLHSDDRSRSQSRHGHSEVPRLPHELQADVHAFGQRGRLGMTSALRFRERKWKISSKRRALRAVLRRYGMCTCA